jgi:hypothetical protein
MLLQDTGAGPSRPKPKPNPDTAGHDGVNNMLGANPTTQEEEAAVMIQKHWRGHQSRHNHPQTSL